MKPSPSPVARRARLPRMLHGGGEAPAASLQRAAARRAVGAGQRRERLLEIAGDELADARVGQPQQDARATAVEGLMTSSVGEIEVAIGRPSAMRRSDASAWRSARRPAG